MIILQLYLYSYNYCFAVDSVLLRVRGIVLLLIERWEGC